MPPKEPSLYNLNKTTTWFAVASFVLFIGLVVMVFQDSTREWKVWQRKFMDYSRGQAQEQLEAAKKSMNQKKLEQLQADLEKAKKEVANHQGTINTLQAEMDEIDLRITKANTRYQELKQHQDSDKYFYEDYHAHGKEKKAGEFKKRLESRSGELEAAKLELDQLETEKEKKLAELKAITGKEKEISREIDQLTGAVARIQRNIDSLKPSWITALLNAPMLDFIKPTLQIQQIVVENLHDDYYFTHVQKVDRCVSCHLGVDKKGFEGAPAPFKTHPRLDLFVSSDSPHPAEEFGCTSCHGGSGHSLSFITAAHTPKNEEQQKEWEEKYHWKPMKHWTEKMLPLNHVEASCTKCHGGVVEVPEAPKLNEGRRLMRAYGCTGCHKIEGFEDSWKVGPDLRHVQSKLDQDWITRWIHHPKEFRESTKMPQIFNLENTSDPESRERSNAAVAGIAAYLMRNSESVTLQSPKVPGDPSVGEKLIKETGCLGCHTAAGESASNFGPELTGLGSKLTPDWLYTWLKDPKHYSETTRMPNLRLSDEEASHITAYLLSDKNEKFESTRSPLVKPEVVDELAMHFLTGRLREDQALEELSKMPAEDRLEYVGQKSIAHFGCYGCHTIKGFESANPIGTELSQHGIKDVHRLDFGFVHIPHTRHDWFYHKLKTPRIYDEDKVKPYHDKLKMPQFGFSDEEAEALTTFLLSLQNPRIPLEMKRRLSTAEEQIEAGRFLAEKYNCQGCHTLDGKEGGVRVLFDDLGNAPPVLDGEGKKVQPGWLYHFLEQPVAIRPWLQYRMPTFGFTEEEITQLIQYFNNLDQVPPAYLSNRMRPPTEEELKIGKTLFDSFQCVKCHKSNPEPGLTASFLAPDLVMSKDRLRPDWVADWLEDPQALQEGTMMPGFFPDGQSPLPDVMDGDAERQIRAIRDYLWRYHPEKEAKSSSAAASESAASRTSS